MSLKQNIADKEGNSALLSTVLRTACLLLSQKNKKSLTLDVVNIAIKIHFTENKKKQALKEGNKNLDIFRGGQEVFQNLEQINTQIKKFTLEFLNLNKIMSESLVFLMGIYDNIQNYQIEEITYDSEIDIKHFLRCVDLICCYEVKLSINNSHYFKAKQILNPNNISIVWTFERTPENIKNQLKNRKIDNSFLNLLIYKI